MVMFVLMTLLTLVVVGFGLRLPMLGEISLEYVGGGILLFWFCIGSLLPFLVQSLTVMTLLVWPLTLLFGLLGAFQRGVALWTLGMLLCFRVLFIFGILIGLVFFLLPLLLRMSVSGRTLLGFWSCWLLFWVLFIGPLLLLTWDLEVFPMFSFLSFMRFGLVRGFSLRRQFLVVTRSKLGVFLLGVVLLCL